MFELLNEQPFILTFDLINTLIVCTEIGIEQRTGDEHFVSHRPSFGYLKDENNVIPYHL